MKKTIIIMTLLLSSTVLFSQEKGHYLSVGGTLGSSKLTYSLQNGEGKVKSGLGYGGKLGYSYFFSKHFGVGTGLGISAYRTTAHFDYDIKFNDLIDDEGDDYNRIVSLRDWKERQKTTFIEIPLLFQFQYKFGKYEGFGLYANLGIKAQIPVSSGYEVTNGTMENQGEYHKWGEPILYGMPNHGYGTTEPRPSGDVKLKTGFAATASLGFLVSLTRIIDLQVGAYCDYGFTNKKKEEIGSIVYLDDQSNNQYRSLLTSTDIGKVRSLSVGGELGLRFKLDGSSREPRKQAKARDAAEEQAKREADEAEKAAVAVRAKRDAERADKQEAAADKRAADLNDRLKNIEDLLKQSLSGGRPGGRSGGHVIRMPGDDVDTIHTSFEADVLFETGSSKLQPRFRQMLIPLVQILQENPMTTIDIIGHTDDVGSLDFNQRLSTQRAQEVSNFLISMGVNRRQIGRVVGRNFSVPVATNATPEGRAKNRRVDILMYVDKN